MGGPTFFNAKPPEIAPSNPPRGGIGSSAGGGIAANGDIGVTGIGGTDGT